MLVPWQKHLLIAALFIQFFIASHCWEEDALPGWMGETHRGKLRYKKGLRGRRSLVQKNNGVDIDPTKVIQLSWKPRAFLYKGLLTEEECDHIVDLAKDKVQRSTVVSTYDSKSSYDDIRTSYGMFLAKAQDEVVRRVEAKIAAWTFLPVENGESIQVLRYNYNEKYESHFDYFYDEENKQQGGHRMATVLMYLSDVEKGGETVFPNSAEKEAKDDSWSECGKRGVAVKPRKGDALLFFSLKPDASPDEFSLHAGCPVLKGTKWSATKWIHVKAFDPPTRDPNKCENDNPHCEEWAAAGECEKNKPYMIGEGSYIGTCRRACKACNSHLVGKV